MTITPPAVPETFSVVLRESCKLTERVKSLVFERTDGRPFHFQSGQWVSVVLPHFDDKGRPLRRSYSIASVPQGNSQFELVVTLVDGGIGSTYLHQLPVGSMLEVKGPQGTFARPLDVGPSLFVATGTGIAPFRGMFHDALASGRTEPLWLLFGVRTSRDALFASEFERWASQHPHVRFCLTLSRAEDDWNGRRGYVQSHVLPLWEELKTHGQPHAYICGVKKMLVEVREVLKMHGHAERKQLHLESYD